MAATDDTAESIAARNRQRHAHNVDQERCKHCGSFVDKGQPDGGRLRYSCPSCGRAIMEYVGRR